MRRHLQALITLAAAGALAFPNALDARQGPADGAAPDRSVERARSPGFSFGRPSVTLTIRGGGFLPRARGQFFDFATEELTLERNDFRGLAGGVDLGIWVNDHVEVLGSLDLAGVTRGSEDRDFLEPRGDELVPIEQSTRLRYGPALTGGVKVYPTGRGDELSQFIWIPTRVAPYLSGGIGGTGWKLEQVGDFVDASGEEPFIFTDRFETRGFSFISFLGAGVDVSLNPRVALTLDSRYVFGDGRMADDFIEFVQPLDLSGLRLTAGLSFRF